MVRTIVEQTSATRALFGTNLPHWVDNSPNLSTSIRGSSVATKNCASTGCLTIGGKVVFGFCSDVPENLESSRPWSVYYSGPKGQRNRPSGSKVIDDFVVRDLRGTLQKTTSFSKSSSHGAAHPSRACRNMRFSTQTFVANLFSYMCLAPSVQ